jgi:hypothetical protein
VTCFVNSAWLRCAPRKTADKTEDGELNSPLRNLLRGALEEFVDESLIGLGLLGGKAAKLGEQIPTCIT